MTRAIDDADLLRRLRAGEDRAFSELFAEHSPAVRRLARAMARNRSEAEDIAAETFFRVLRAIKRGNGPTDNVRGYLLTVARRVVWEWQGGAQDVPVSDDELTNRAGVAESPASRFGERTLITRAFTSLPERWRTVLWQTEVEGAQPAVVAPQFGLSPNATAALARRARQGLRAAYLQAHLGSGSGGSCRSVRDKLGSYTAGVVTGSETDRIEAHLAGCGDCRATHDELRDVSYSLRGDAGVVAFAVPAAAAAGSGGGSSLLAAVKSTVTGMKAKVGVAIAATTAAGILGVTAGGQLVDYSETAANFGFDGDQGIPAVTIERSLAPDNAPVRDRVPDTESAEPSPVEETSEPEADQPEPAEPDADNAAIGEALSTTQVEVVPANPDVADSVRPQPAAGAPKESPSSDRPSRGPDQGGRPEAKPEPAPEPEPSPEPEPEPAEGDRSAPDDDTGLPADRTITSQRSYYDGCDVYEETGYYYDEQGERVDYYYYERDCTGW